MARNRRISKSRKTSSMPLSQAELKLFAVFLYYLFSGALQLTTFAISTRHINSDINALMTYFNCQRSGEDSSCSLDVKQSPVWSLFALMVFLLFPVVNLFFAIKFSDFKLLFTLLCKACVKRGRKATLQCKSTGRSSL